MSSFGMAVYCSTQYQTLFSTCFNSVETHEGRGNFEIVKVSAACFPNCLDQFKLVNCSAAEREDIIGMYVCIYQAHFVETVGLYYQTIGRFAIIQ